MCFQIHKNIISNKMLNRSFGYPYHHCICARMLLALCCAFSPLHFLVLIPWSLFSIISLSRTRNDFFPEICIVFWLMFILHIFVNICVKQCLELFSELGHTHTIDNKLSLDGIYFVYACSHTSPKPMKKHRAFLHVATEQKIMKILYPQSTLAVETNYIKNQISTIRIWCLHFSSPYFRSLASVRLRLVWKRMEIWTSVIMYSTAH